MLDVVLTPDCGGLVVGPAVCQIMRFRAECLEKRERSVRHRHPNGKVLKVAQSQDRRTEAVRVTECLRPQGESLIPCRGKAGQEVVPERAGGHHLVHSPVVGQENGAWRAWRLVTPSSSKDLVGTRPKSTWPASTISAIRWS